MISLTVGATTVQLPPDLLWADELGWSAVEKAETRSITGARIVQTGLRLGGRPITLQPPDDSGAWMPRAVLEQVYAWAQQQGLTLALSLRGVARTVEFRHNEACIEAKPVQHYADTDPDDHYLVTLRLTET